MKENVSMPSRNCILKQFLVSNDQGLLIQPLFISAQGDAAFAFESISIYMYIFQRHGFQYAYQIDIAQCSVWSNFIHRILMTKGGRVL